MRYLEWSLLVPPDAVEAVTGLLHERIGGGVVVDDSAVPVRVSAYLPLPDGFPPAAASSSAEGGAPAGAGEEDGRAAVRARLARLPAFFPGLGAPGSRWWGEESRLVEDEDWAEAWKAYFKPLKVGRLAVVPTWEEYAAAPGEVVLRLDPGMAFGTGQHASTALCLGALDRLSRPGMEIMDVGTGSGILAVAAALLGARRVVALDIDPVAVEAARANSARNGVADLVEVVCGEVAGQPAASADLVVANIVADVLVDIRADLARVLRPGGLLVLSGVIDREAGRVAAAFEALGLQPRGAEEREGWTALVFARPGGGGA